MPKILQYVNHQYRDTVGHNVRRTQILKFDLAKKLHGQSMECVKACEDIETKEKEINEKQGINPEIDGREKSDK